MKCPLCSDEVSMLKFTTFGTMCDGCYKFLGGQKTDPEKPATQMEIFKSIGKPFYDEFVTPKKGMMTLAYANHGCAKNPFRMLGVSLSKANKSSIRPSAVFWMN